MSRRLTGRVAIVTGASRERGIGTAVCRALAAEGANIMFTHWGRYDESDGCGAEHDWPTSLQEELTRMGVRSARLEADLADPDVPAAIIEYTRKELGAPSILINNACYCVGCGFHEMTSELLDRHYRVNIRGTSMLSMEFAKQFEQQLQGIAPGRIVFLVSKGPDPDNLAYTATKGALIALTEPLSVALAPLGITVNCIDPGPTDTGWMSDEIRGRLQPLFPAGRIGLPEDAANGIALLCSDEAQWMTGQLIRSEGGFIGK
ncbi:SDR family oxidoreductase [Paenibacillus piri]|uniref:SDR family oxidoreductase n=1 Tax=Paenibacillus piri TaxID=2547395 RepID=A0A4R5KY88_9BACL|nr:SDR family oxidoreductase [Paenibacillus piri]TDG00553.1 SDR family oxidoreductase [Paenibacillus piri]